jgi:hypothetical protein
VFNVVAIVLVVRFLRTGGPAMLAMMDRPPDPAAPECGGGSEIEPP